MDPVLHGEESKFLPARKRGKEKHVNTNLPPSRPKWRDLLMDFCRVNVPTRDDGQSRSQNQIVRAANTLRE